MLPRNVLIFHLGGLGDFVLTWPLALALGRLFAQSRIMYVTHGQKGELAEAVLRVESADVEAGWHHLFAPDPRLPETAIRRLAGAHSIFSFISRPDDVWTSNVRALAPNADIVTLEPRLPATGYAKHASEFLVEQLAASSPAIKSAVEQMLRAINDRGVVPRPPITDGSIAIHPGSGGERKCWPRHRFIELIERLTAAKKPVRVVLGEAETEKWTAAEVGQFEQRAQVVRPSSVTELLHVLGTAGAVVANDSGPAHLAGIVSAPTVVLFGPSDPAVWRPLGPSVTVIRGEPIDTIAVQQVYDTVLALPGV